jgi:hypothetical protein
MGRKSILRAAAVGVGGLMLALFVGTIPLALRHGRNTLTTDDTGLCHRTFFPFRRDRRVDRGLVRGVRLSTRLVLKGAWGQRPSVDASMIAVDLLVQEGPWLRTILPADDAIWFRDRVAEMLRL